MASGGGGRRKTKTHNGGKFFLPHTKQQVKICIGRISIQFFNILFKFADSAMYLLGPLLITVASAIIGGLTYVYFRVVLPMLAGSNWVLTNNDLHVYWRKRGYVTETADEGIEENGSVPISHMSSTLLALSTPIGILHTILVSFFLYNIIYNYAKCVRTSNSGSRYDLVVKELANVTGFHYPESEEELAQWKKNFERKIYEKVQKKRKEMMDERTKNNEGAAAATALSATATSASTRNNCTPGSQAVLARQDRPLPRIHNWQLLSPIEWGYCRYSSRPKPPRSHYDHVTKLLVLNMDHYCPWMFNVIGYFNYRYFFNFLWFVILGLSYGAAICYQPFMNLGSPAYRDQLRTASGWGKHQLKDLVVRHNSTNAYIPTPSERTPIALGFMLCLCLAVAVLCLGGFHLYLVLNAFTTIEFHGSWSKRRKGGWTNPYSAGCWRRNWEMIYGTRYWSHHNIGSSSSRKEEAQYRYYGIWGVLVAMMPSDREPEFLPIPIGGELVRRKDRGRERVTRKTDDGIGEGIDLEMASTEEAITLDFLMGPKDENGPLVGRSRACRFKKQRVV